MNKRGAEVDLVALATAVGRSHAEVESTYRRRSLDELAWTEAGGRLHRDVADFEEGLALVEASLRANEKGATDAALAFLEADLWTFRSGYAKERVLRRLASAQVAGDVPPPHASVRPGSWGDRARREVDRDPSRHPYDHSSHRDSIESIRVACDGDGTDSHSAAKHRRGDA